jgi:hypothetical protein
MEVTKSSKPSTQRVASGDSALCRPRKIKMREPTWHFFREGRRRGGAESVGIFFFGKCHYDRDHVSLANCRRGL